jgi:hypothetical protein
VPGSNAPISLETLRDLLGIARALYASWRKDGMGPIEMEELRSIGEDLREAYRLASKTKQGTGAYLAALTKAERATKRFGDIIQHDTVKQLVSFTGQRLGFAAPNARPFFDRNSKHERRVKRG